MTIAVLALQGAFIEHEKIFHKLGCDVIELREKGDLNRPFNALVLPGGESTAQGKLLHDLDMFEDLKRRITQGLPTMATCSGLILLAKNIENDPARYFATLPVTVRRNAYGRQLGSFYTEEAFDGIGTVPMTFIRAPYISNVGEGANVLASVRTETGSYPVAVRYRNQLAMAFHPELHEDTRIHAYFLKEFCGG